PWQLVGRYCQLNTQGSRSRYKASLKRRPEQQRDIVMLGSPDNGIPVARTPEARRRAIVMPLVIALAVAAVALLL
ncbi:hypothetical protein ACFJV7_13295, partial [Enterococcus faecalis]